MLPLEGKLVLSIEQAIAAPFVQGNWQIWELELLKSKDLKWEI